MLSRLPSLVPWNRADVETLKRSRETHYIQGIHLRLIYNGGSAQRGLTITENQTPTPNPTLFPAAHMVLRFPPSGNWTDITHIYDTQAL